MTKTQFGGILRQWIPRKLHFTLFFFIFSPEKLPRTVILLKEVKPSPDWKMIIYLIRYITCFRHCNIFSETRSRMTTAIAISRRNYASSCARYLVLRKSSCFTFNWSCDSLDLTLTQCFVIDLHPGYPSIKIVPIIHSSRAHPGVL